MLGKLKYILLTATLLCGVACSPDNPDEPNNGNDPEPGNKPELVTEINGTTIAEGNNIFGLISDSVTGKGIAGVPVTDGSTFVVTDNNGVYQMKASRWVKRVWFTIPAEYEVPVDPENGRPLFYATKDIVRQQQNRNDWTLTPLAQPEDEFTIVAIGDPQCEVEKEADRFKTETLADISSTVGSISGTQNLNAYAITLGDITFDNTPLWPTMAKLCSSVTIANGKKMPIFNCIGNHDHDASQTDDASATKLYIENVGPTDYSFNRGKVHFVVMDNIVCTTTSGSTWSYDAGFSGSQYNWLKADLDLVKDKDQKMVVLSCHIPFRGGSTSGGSNVNKDKYYQEVLSLLAQFKEAHIFIGHTHYPQNYRHSTKSKDGSPIYEHVHGGACGGWWSSNIGVDGSPNGYSIYHVKGATFHNWVAKGTGMSEKQQMRVYDGNDTYGQKYVYSWYDGGVGGSKNIATPGRSYLKNCFIATVWNDLNVDWKVELIVDGQSYPMTRTTQSVADMCATAFFFNNKGKNTTSWNKALLHYWYVEFPGKKPSEVKNWEVRATQTIKSSGEVNVYSETAFTRDYSGF